MGLTTERKVFLGLMAIAGASLIIDQAILSPGSADAAPLDNPSAALMPKESLLAGITQPIAKSVTQVLNERLSKVDLGSTINASLETPSSDLQQLFAPLIKPAAHTQGQSTVQLQDQLQNPQQNAVAAQPEQKIPTNLPVLSAVMPSRSGKSGAILDATLYRIGETTPNGYRLINVEQRQVLVEYQGNQFWLTLPAFVD